ncbi:hypothetical protein AwDysgo_19560 [Bacteroidales bacterium]|nr:hypothetical protein AwDysgo_19560 [Bacteroidales bacterium]
MRYIQKKEVPNCIKNWIEQRTGIGQSVFAYNDFDKKAELNAILRAEQHNICCYCQQKLTHYQEKERGGSHNEHLIPQQGQFGDKKKAMAYSNIFACCIDSQGLKRKEKDKRHCGESKGDKSIRCFIQEEECGELFRYNLSGEILPNGLHDSFADYQENRTNLSENVLEALMAIEILNLNCKYLVEDRKKDITSLIYVLNIKTEEEVVNIIREFESDTHYPRYIDMLIYYMRQKSAHQNR